MIQIWGGGFYLLNKIFFSLMERSHSPKKQKWQIRTWVVYLVGLPAWTFIYLSEHNWMAAAVGVGGGTSMVLGLIVSIKGIKKAPKWLKHIALLSAFLGVSYSLCDFFGLY